MTEREYRCFCFWFVAAHVLAALAVAALFLNRRLLGGTDTCAMHAVLHLYCPACGGTRAVAALLSLHPLRALRLYPPLYVLIVLLAEVEWRGVRCLVRRDRRAFEHYSGRRFLWLAGAVVLWFVLRNLLLIAFRIDITGDFIR